jgi:hypothetical protein
MRPVSIHPINYRQQFLSTRPLSQLRLSTQTVASPRFSGDVGNLIGGFFTMVIAGAVTLGLWGAKAYSNHQEIGKSQIEVQKKVNQFQATSNADLQKRYFRFALDTVFTQIQAVELDKTVLPENVTQTMSPEQQILFYSIVDKAKSVKDASELQPLVSEWLDKGLPSSVPNEVRLDMLAASEEYFKKVQSQEKYQAALFWLMVISGSTAGFGFVRMCRPGNTVKDMFTWGR